MAKSQQTRLIFGYRLNNKRHIIRDSKKKKRKKGEITGTGEEESGSSKRVHFPRLMGDRRRLKQVLSNLVKNALKATKRGLVEVVADYEYA